MSLLCFVVNFMDSNAFAHTKRLTQDDSCKSYNINFPLLLLIDINLSVYEPKNCKRTEDYQVVAYANQLSRLLLSLLWKWLKTDIKLNKCKVKINVNHRFEREQSQNIRGKSRGFTEVSESNMGLLTCWQSSHRHVEVEFSVTS